VGLATLSSTKPSASDALRQLAEPARPTHERAAAVVGLLSLDLPEAASLAAQVLTDESSSPFVPGLLNAILERQGGLLSLLAALERLAPAREPALIALRVLSSSGKENGRLQSILAKAARLGDEPMRFTAEQLRAFVQEVRQQGKAAKGAEVFRRAELGCA